MGYKVIQLQIQHLKIHRLNSLGEWSQCPFSVLLTDVSLFSFFITTHGESNNEPNLSETFIFCDKRHKSEFFHTENLRVNHRNHDFTQQSRATVWAPCVKGVSLSFLDAGSWRYSALTLTWSFEIAINAFILQGGLVKVSLRGIYDVVFHPPLPIFKHWVMAAEMCTH